MTNSNAKRETVANKYLTPLRKELEEDAKIDRVKMASDLTQLTSLQAKWLNYHTRFKETWIIRNKKLKELRTEKFMTAVNGTGGFSVTKTEARLVISGDRDIVDLEEQIDILEMILDFITSAQQIIRDKGFTITNIIRLEEFEAGMG